MILVVPSHDSKDIRKLSEEFFEQEDKDLTLCCYQSLPDSFFSYCNSSNFEKSYSFEDKDGKYIDISPDTIKEDKLEGKKILVLQINTLSDLSR